MRLILRSLLASVCLFVCIEVHLPAICEAAIRAETRLASQLPKKARWSLVVLDRENGRERLAWGNAQTSSLVPASLVKLITTGAVLDAVEKKEISPEAFVGTGKRKGRAGKNAGGADARLDRYLRYMNVHSVNYMAENLFLRLGEKRYGSPATVEKGQRAIAHYLAGFDLPKKGMTIIDGSGLSRKDRFTARAMSRYLYQISQRPWFPRLLATLPRPGLEGTVRHLGYVNSQFRAKTGRLDDVFSLAGFGNDRHGRGLVFVFLVNLSGKGTDRRNSRGYLVKLLAEGDILPAR